MKKILTILIICLMIIPTITEAKTLQDLYNQLANLQAEYNSNQKTNGSVIYLCERELRVKDNFALQFAIQKTKNSQNIFRFLYYPYTFTPSFKISLNNSLLLTT